MKGNTMSTVSTYLDNDIARGDITYVQRAVTRNGITRVIARDTNGKWWVYMDQETAMRTGEVCREFPYSPVMDRVAVDFMFND
jgi:hypothetical protein